MPAAELQVATPPAAPAATPTAAAGTSSEQKPTADMVHTHVMHTCITFIFCWLIWAFLWDLCLRITPKTIVWRFWSYNNTLLSAVSSVKHTHTHTLLSKIPSEWLILLVWPPPSDQPLWMGERLPIVTVMERSRGDEWKRLKKRRMKENRKSRAMWAGREKVQPWRRKKGGESFWRDHLLLA